MTPRRQNKNNTRLTLRSANDEGGQFESKQYNSCSLVSGYFIVTLHRYWSLRHKCLTDQLMQNESAFRCNDTQLPTLSAVMTVKRSPSVYRHQSETSSYESERYVDAGVR